MRAVFLGPMKYNTEQKGTLPLSLWGPCYLMPTETWNPVEGLRALNTQSQKLIFVNRLWKAMLENSDWPIQLGENERSQDYLGKCFVYQSVSSLAIKRLTFFKARKWEVKPSEGIIERVFRGLTKPRLKDFWGVKSGSFLSFKSARLAAVPFDFFFNLKPM